MKMITSFFVAVSFLFFSCKKNEDSAASNAITTTIPEVYKKIYGASDMYVEGNYIIIKTNALPDHKSPYYKSTQWESTKYEAYNGTNTSYFSNNAPIQQQNLSFKIPLNPVAAANHQATPLGPIGVSLNGVPFFNQYAGNGASLGSMELNTFDQYNGHATPMNGGYHYHSEPFWITTNKGKTSLLGFLLDGFPVYGPVENGITITNANLDSYHGHTGVTTDYPNGIYHYHVTSNDPYINGNGYYGTPGTVSQ
jgi:hypothetical protein